MSEESGKYAAECFGTFTLVFAGTGAIVANDLSGGVIGHLGIALTFGLAVLVMIYTIGDISGCHINPAVTIGLSLSGRFDWKQVLPYVASQSCGALLASLAMRVLFPAHGSLGITVPTGGALQSFVMEFLLTLILMVAILSISNGSGEHKTLAGIVIGSLIAMEAIFAGPVSGASMNPARSLGPAIISLHFESLWIYLTAPLLGGIASVFVCRMIRGRKCCC